MRWDYVNFLLVSEERKTRGETFLFLLGVWDFFGLFFFLRFEKKTNKKQKVRGGGEEKPMLLGCLLALKDSLFKEAVSMICYFYPYLWK